MSLGIDYSCKGWLHQCPEAFRWHFACVFAPLFCFTSASPPPSAWPWQPSQILNLRPPCHHRPFSFSPLMRLPPTPTCHPASPPPLAKKKKVPKLALTFFKWNWETVLWLIMTAGARSLRKRRAVIYQPTQWQLWGAPWKAFHRGAG